MQPARIAPEKPGWTSATTKPEEGRIVLVFLNGAHPTMPECSTVAYWDGEWRSPEHHMPMTDAKHITHWHPLPGRPNV
jgi:hypothetical protein